ncbi:hypothetical protein ATE48_02635 [Candidatus Viadribacter manganicus]|uniref:Uncharacterized protein n=1 Tax=Candidatus Viadribacter manganicus TaxID=1759059 RepID=A0A1B1AEC0_9PROT|nr:hypothetical protein ATE48_02635 [Candidatus Viadribacter manganicus]
MDAKSQPTQWASHPVGARIVKFDQRLARMNIGAHEWQEALHVVVPPSGAQASSVRAEAVDIALPHVSARPWAPAHVRAVRGVRAMWPVSWVRCARLGGDSSWAAGEPPLGGAGGKLPA